MNNLINTIKETLTTARHIGQEQVQNLILEAESYLESLEVLASSGKQEMALIAAIELKQYIDNAVQEFNFNNNQIMRQI